MSVSKGSGSRCSLCGTATLLFSPHLLLVNSRRPGHAVPNGFGAALLVRRQFALNSETTARATADRLLAEARTKQKDIILEAKDEALKVAKSAEVDTRERRAELQRYESRLDKKDEQLDAQTAELTAKEKKLAEKEAAVEVERAKVAQLQDEQQVELARV